MRARSNQWYQWVHKCQQLIVLDDAEEVALFLGNEGSHLLSAALLRCSRRAAGSPARSRNAVNATTASSARRSYSSGLEIARQLEAAPGCDALPALATTTLEPAHARAAPPRLPRSSEPGARSGDARCSSPCRCPKDRSWTRTGLRATRRSCRWRSFAASMLGCQLGVPASRQSLSVRSASAALCPRRLSMPAIHSSRLRCRSDCRAPARAAAGWWRARRPCWAAALGRERIVVHPQLDQGMVPGTFVCRRVTFRGPHGGIESWIPHPRLAAPGY